MAKEQKVSGSEVTRGVISWQDGVSFRLPSAPPSMNSAYNVLFAQRRVEMKPEVRRYKTLMKVYVPGLDVAGNDVIAMRVSVAQNWHYKNGKLKRQDVANMLKILVDLICEKQGWDDARLWELWLEKVQAEEEAVYVEVRKGLLTEPPEPKA